METNSPRIGAWEPGLRRNYSSPPPQPSPSPRTPHTSTRAPPAAAGHPPAAPGGSHRGLPVPRPSGASGCFSAFSGHLRTIAGNVFREPSLRPDHAGGHGEERRSPRHPPCDSLGAPRGGDQAPRATCSARGAAPRGTRSGFILLQTSGPRPFPSCYRASLPGRQRSDSRETARTRRWRLRAARSFTSAK